MSWLSRLFGTPEIIQPGLELINASRFGGLGGFWLLGGVAVEKIEVFHWGIGTRVVGC